MTLPEYTHYPRLLYIIVVPTLQQEVQGPLCLLESCCTLTLTPVSFLKFIGSNLEMTIITVYTSLPCKKETVTPALQQTYKQEDQNVLIMQQSIQQCAFPSIVPSESTD